MIARIPAGEIMGEHQAKTENAVWQQGGEISKRNGSVKHNGEIKI